MEKGSHKHFKNHKWIPNSVQETSSSRKAVKSKCSEISNQVFFRNDSRNKKAHRIQCYPTNSSSDGVPLYSVFKEENQRRKSSHIQSKTSERLRFHPKISTRESAANPFTSTKRRLHDENRHLAGIFSHSNNAKPPSVSLSRVSRNYLRNAVSTFWPGQCSVSIRQGDKLGRPTTETRALTSDRLLRRFSNHPRESSNTGNASEICHKIHDGPGMANKSLKNISICSDETRVFGNIVGHERKHQMLVGNQGSPTKDSHIRSSTPSAMELDGRESDPGQAKLCIAGCTIRETPLPHVTACFEAPTFQQPSLEIPHSSTCENRIRLVAEERPQTYTHSFRQSIDLHHHRCCRRGLGCHSKQPSSLEQMDTDPEKLAQQYERAVGGLRSPSMPRPRSFSENGNITIGQSHNCGVHQQTGWNEINDIAESDYENTFVLREFAVSSSCPTHSGSLQWLSRQLITTKDSARVAPQQANCSLAIREVRHTTNRPLCFKEICSCTKLRQRRCCRPSEPVHGCVQQEMAIQAGMDLSSSCNNSASSTPPRHFGGTVPHHRPAVGQSLLETRSPTTSRRASVYNTGSSQERNRSAHEPSTSGSRPLKIGGLDGSGWANHVKDWSDSEISLLESSWRKSTLKTYKPVWKRWCQWASSINIPADNPEPQDLAKYLCYLYTDVKLAPRTIALHKSVVANFSNPLRAPELSSHPSVKHIIKGVFARCPPTKKGLSWKIEDLLSYLKTYTFNEDSIFEVSRHTCILLLLATGRRVHDLTLLSIENGAFEDNGDEMIFWPKFGSKTDTHSYRQSGWLLKKSLETSDKKLDLVFWVRKLITVSKDRRLSRSLHNLFITTRGLAKHASRTVIAGWIRTLFKDAGILAAAGSFRAAVASHNWTNGQHNIDQILQRGNWRSKNTFFQHYFKELKDSSRSNSNVLNSCFLPM